VLGTWRIDRADDERMMASVSDLDPHLRMRELTLEQSITGAPAQTVGAAAIKLVLDDIVQGRFPSIVALTLRGTACRIWQLRDIAPVDDFVRAIARREEAEAVVVVAPAPMPPGLEGDRCVAVVAECESGAFEHLVVFKAGPGGEMFRICGRISDGSTPFRWFGVPPVGAVAMWVEGIVGMGGWGPRGTGGTRGTA
jgi:hypothetical protein